MSLYQLNKGYDGPNNILHQIYIKNALNIFGDENHYDLFTFDASTGEKIKLGITGYDVKNKD